MLDGEKGVSFKSCVAISRLVESNSIGTLKIMG
jgi:hypothetical protein